MRYLLTIVVAMFAVACSQGERQDTAADAREGASDAAAATADVAGNVGAAVGRTYEEAKPEINEMGRAVAAGATEVGQEIEETIHENTAPDPDDPSPSASQ